MPEITERIVYRAERGRELTIPEMDNNFQKVANPWSEKRVYSHQDICYYCTENVWNMYMFIGDTNTATSTNERPSQRRVSSGEWVPFGTGEGTTIQGVQGPAGMDGERGLQGIQGVRGLQGIQGVRGIQGVQGIQGERGVQGTQGMRGEPGLQGDAGLSAFDVWRDYTHNPSATEEDFFDALGCDCDGGTGDGYYGFYEIYIGEGEAGRPINISGIFSDYFTMNPRVYTDFHAIRNYISYNNETTEIMPNRSNCYLVLRWHYDSFRNAFLVGGEMYFDASESRPRAFSSGFDPSFA